MDFKSMLNQLSQLSEATKEVPGGRSHRADPGGYGRKFDTDEEGDEKQEKKAEGPKKRGRPAKTGEHSPEEQKKAKEREKAGKELQSFIVGNLPKDHDKKKGTVVKGKAQSGDKGDKKKKSVKEWVQEIEGKYIAEAGLTPTQTIVPGFQAGGKVAQPTVIDVKNPALKAALDKAAKDKQVTAVGIPQTTSTTPSPSGSTGQAPVGTAQVQEKWAGDAKVKATGEYAGKSVAELKSMLAKLHKSGPHKRGSEEEKKMHQINFALRAKGHWKKGEGAASKQDMSEGDIPSVSGVDTLGAGLGVGRSATTLESKTEKKKVDESMDHRLKAAHHMGKSHALAKEAYSCKYDDMDEARCYHDGYKEGLDECYGQMPIVGLVSETDAIPATVSGMADQAEGLDEMDMYEMDKTEYMKHKAKTTPGDTFKAFGQTMKDSDVLDEFAFESWDKELNALLTESEQVDEGMTVSISKGQQGAPDSVSVTAQDGEADQLLGLIKQAGLGLFGDKEPSGYGAPEGSSQAHGDINVVGDHDGMMALIKKVAGGEAPSSDYKDEEGEEHHDHDHADEEECSECGYMESDCKCEKEMVDEVESEDQMTYEVAEDNAPDSDEAETSADENAEAAEDAALAAADQQNKTATVNEWANAVGKGPGKGTDASFEQDIEFMTKVISGGLNKPKSTGQTTIPVIAGQDTRMEDPMAWAKLAGIKK